MAFLPPGRCRHDELQMSPGPGESPGALGGGGGGGRAISAHWSWTRHGTPLETSRATSRIV